MELSGRTEQWLEEYYKEKWNSSLEEKRARNEQVITEPELSNNQPMNFEAELRKSGNLTLPISPSPGLARPTNFGPLLSITPPLSPVSFHQLLSPAPIVCSSASNVSELSTEYHYCLSSSTCPTKLSGLFQYLDSLQPSVGTPGSKLYCYTCGLVSTSVLATKTDKMKPLEFSGNTAGYREE